jgi:hypothetical protein
MYAAQACQNQTVGRLIAAQEPCTAQSPKHTESALISLSHTIEQLEGSLAALIGKLNPILLPAIPSPDKKVDGQMENMCNIAETVFSCAHAVETIRMAIARVPIPLLECAVTPHEAIHAG